MTDNDEDSSLLMYGINNSKIRAKKFYEIDSSLWFEMQKFWKEVFATWVWANTVHTDAQNQTVWPSLAEN